MTTEPFESLPHEAQFTCRTELCPVKDVTFNVIVYSNQDGEFRGVCGGCNTPITDMIVNPDPVKVE